MKTAIVYDWIDKWGGVERLLLRLTELYPEAHWYTSYLDRKSAPWANNLSITTSFIQRLPAFIRSNRLLSLIFYPYAFECFDFKGYDVVISVSSSFAKSVITKPGTKHICYMLTPTRYLWGMTDDYITGWKKWLAVPLLRKLRKWDYVAAQRPDKIITLSHFVAERINTYYQREAEVIYPPFDLDYWKKIRHTEFVSAFKIPKQVRDEGYFLVVSRLEPYKKVELAIKAFTKRSDNLVIVGKGTQKTMLQQIATKNIHFIDDLSDEELGTLYKNAKALIMSQEEDFGYVALEAQACGCPIICYRQSGATEALLQKNSTLFDQQNESSLGEALERFEAVAYNVESKRSIDNGFFDRFSINTFRNRLLSVIKN